MLRDPLTLPQKWCLSRKTGQIPTWGRTWREIRRDWGPTYLPGLRTALLPFLSRNFEVDARLARNAVLSRMPLPALDLVYPVPSKDPTLKASERAMSPSW